LGKEVLNSVAQNDTEGVDIDFHKRPCFYFKNSTVDFCYIFVEKQIEGFWWVCKFVKENVFAITRGKFAKIKKLLLIYLTMLLRKSIEFYKYFIKYNHEWEIRVPLIISDQYYWETKNSGIQYLLKRVDWFFEWGS
jgi:hypothetical protein